MYISGFKIGDRYIALNVAFITNNTIFSYTPVCDPELIKYSIIRLLKLKHIEECHNNGISVYDFCLGGEEYKFNFNPEIRQLYSFILYRRNIKGYLKKIFDELVKPFVKNRLIPLLFITKSKFNISKQEVK
jgi:CelD/BcsL family acetyltransferase involved in cellulose biosynthesis